MFLVLQQSNDLSTKRLRHIGLNALENEHFNQEKSAIKTNVYLLKLYIVKLSQRRNICN